MTTKYDDVSIEDLSTVEPVTMTTWVNTQDRTVKFSYLTHVKTGKKASGGLYQNVVLKPGQRVKIPSEFDCGIRDERNGIVVGGLAPFLLKEGESQEDVTLHSCLDYKNVTADVALQELAARLKKEDELARAVKFQGDAAEAAEAKKAVKKPSKDKTE